MNGNNEKDCDNENQTLLPKKKFKVIGYLFSLMTALCYFVLLTSSQVSSLKINIFELFACRYFISVIFVFLVSCYKKEPLKVNKLHIKYIVGMIIIDAIQSPCILSAATFMPTGNVDAFHNALFILFASVYDTIRKQISRIRMFCALITVVGIILLLQPWHAENIQRVGIPCNHLDGTKFYDFINQTKVAFFNNLTAVNKQQHQTWFFRHQTLIGYLLTTLAALGLTCRSNIAKFVLKEYSTPAILVWVYLAGFFVSVLISVIWKLIKHEPVIDPNMGSYCILFTCMCIVFSAIVNCVSYYSVRYIHVSSVALTFVCTTVLLYISQITFLKSFHPGNANIVEVSGIVICILGMVLLTAIEAVQKLSPMPPKE